MLASDYNGSYSKPTTTTTTKKPTTSYTPSKTPGILGTTQNMTNYAATGKPPSTQSTSPTTSTGTKPGFTMPIANQKPAPSNILTQIQKPISYAANGTPQAPSPTPTAPANSGAIAAQNFRAADTTYTPPASSPSGGSYAPYAGGGGAGATSSNAQSTEQQTAQTETASPTPEAAQQMQAENITTIGSTMDNVTQLMTEVRGMGDDALSVAAAQMDKMTQMLDGLEQQIRAQFASQMNGDDPAMQNAIRLIREEADRMKTATLEELNARGLVQSGVYAKALSDMNNNTLNQVQSAVASRFGDLQTQLNSAIMSLAQTRISALSAGQNAVLSTMQNNQNSVTQVGLAGVNAALTERGQNIQQNQFDQTLQFNKDQAAQQNTQFLAQLSQQDRQFYDQLSSTEKMQLASIAASRGSGAAASTLEERKFAWQQEIYASEKADTQSAANAANTNTQVGLAMSAGGIVEQSVNRIASGAATVGTVRTILANSGYTPEAQKAILSAITSDPKVTATTKTTKNPVYSADPALANYTPIKSTYVPTGGYMGNAYDWLTK